MSIWELLDRWVRHVGAEGHARYSLGNQHKLSDICPTCKAYNANITITAHLTRAIGIV